MSKLLIVMSGLPGSGKSTLTRQLVDQYDALVVCSDSIVSAVHGGEYTRYSEALKPLYLDLEETILNHALTLGHPMIVVDRCCPRADTRSRYASLASKCGYTSLLVYFDPDALKDDARIRRRMHDLRGYPVPKWVDVIKKMKAEWEIPLPKKEGFLAGLDASIALTYITGLVVAGSFQPVAPSSAGSVVPLAPSPSEPKTLAVLEPIPVRPVQTELAPPQTDCPPATLGQPPSSTGPKPRLKPARRQSLSPVPVPPGSSESSVQGE